MFDFGGGVVYRCREQATPYTTCPPNFSKLNTHTINNKNTSSTQLKNLYTVQYLVIIILVSVNAYNISVLYTL